ncbi:chromosome partitioning protein ParB [Deinococcus piscis]|uniref:Chromosome partitioning protein ParB n=1 Tax=Deinococcus piscis TaxID=394230 RepID=A0ABQ3KDQ1_9DEIO|nr:ParB/RepB/Spo0J family partition protein [Deinococcus piscis]GHG11131.1 chromosome partitioning protein ParB [Deinococcus piscis]
MAKKVSAASRIDLGKAVENYRREGVDQIEIDQIVIIPGHNPRGYATGEAAFEGPAFEALTQSIRSFGDVFQPIVLRRKSASNLYELIAGERRWRAAKAAGLTHISALVRELNDDQIVRVAREENELREAVSSIDLLFASLDQLASRVGVPVRDLRGVLIRARDRGDQLDGEGPESQVKRWIDLLGLPSLATLVRSARLLDLTPDERQAMREGLSQQAALALLDLGDHPQRGELLEQTLAKGWNAQQLREQIVQLQGKETSAVQHLAKTVRQQLGSRQMGRLPAKKQKRAEQLLRQLEELLGSS